MVGFAVLKFNNILIYLFAQTTLGGTGGGYAARGGSPASDVDGGMFYGLTRYPDQFGSGGGNGTVDGATGGSGGGYLHLTVFGLLLLDGEHDLNDSVIHLFVH